MTLRDHIKAHPEGIDIYQTASDLNMRPVDVMTALSDYLREGFISDLKIDAGVWWATYRLED